MFVKPHGWFTREPGSFGRPFTGGGSVAGPTAPSQFSGAQWDLTDPQSGGDLTLTITGLPSANGSAITALQYSLDGTNWVTMSGTGTGARPITGLTDGASTTAIIRAVNAVGNGPASASKSATPTSAVVLATNSRFMNLAVPDEKLRDGSPGLSAEAAAYAAQGVGVARFDFRQDNLGGGNFATNDPSVAALAAQNVPILAILNKINGSDLSDGPTLAGYVSFASATVTHYVADISWFEALNEPSLDNPQKTPANHYAAMLNALYPAVKAAKPGAILFAGPQGGVDATTGDFQETAGFLQAMYTIAPTSFDVVSYHAYVDSPNISWFSHPGQTWQSRYILLTDVIGTMEANGDFDRQVAVTETGMPQVAPNGDAITDQWGYKWLREVFGELWLLPRIMGLWWYTHINYSPENQNQNSFGMTKLDGTGKKVLHEYKRLANLSNNLSSVFEIEKAASGTTYYPAFRHFVDKTSPAQRNITFGISARTGFSIDSTTGVIAINRATVAAGLAQTVTVTATHTTGAAVAKVLTFDVQNAPVIDGDFAAAGNITGWQLLGSATVDYDADQGALICAITGAGGGYQLSTPVTVASGVVYERGILLKKGTYGGTQVNVFVDNVAATPSALTLPSDYEWRWFTYTTADTAANVSLARNGSFTGTIYVLRDILRVKL